VVSGVEEDTHEIQLQNPKEVNSIDINAKLAHATPGTSLKGV